MTSPVHVVHPWERPISLQFLPLPQCFLQLTGKLYWKQSGQVEQKKLLIAGISLLLPKSLTKQKSPLPISSTRNWYIKLRERRGEVWSPTGSTRTESRGVRQRRTPVSLRAPSSRTRQRRDARPEERVGQRRRASPWAPSGAGGE